MAWRAGSELDLKSSFDMYPTYVRATRVFIESTLAICLFDALSHPIELLVSGLVG